MPTVDRLPRNPESWRARVYAEYRAGNLTAKTKDVLMMLHGFRGAGGIAWPAHATLADRAVCCVRTVQRALHQAQELGLVRWVERRVRAGWRSLRSSNIYRFLMPTTPIQPGVRAPARRQPPTAGQDGGGEKSLSKKAALTAMLAGAARLPDLWLQSRARSDNNDRQWLAGKADRQAQLAQRMREKVLGKGRVLA